MTWDWTQVYKIIGEHSTHFVTISVKFHFI